MPLEFVKLAAVKVPLAGNEKLIVATELRARVELMVRFMASPPPPPLVAAIVEAPGCRVRIVEKVWLLTVADFPVNCSVPPCRVSELPACRILVTGDFVASLKSRLSVPPRIDVLPV